MDDLSAAMKAASAVGGAALALLFKPPKTWIEFWRRLLFSAGAGFVFGEPFRTEYLKWPDTMANVSAAGVVVAFAAWFVVPWVVQALHAVIKAAAK
jgi:hypothetical protein